jgi:hypothetical protein
MIKKIYTELTPHGEKTAKPKRKILSKERDENFNI